MGQWQKDDSMKDTQHREVIRPEWIDYNGHMNVAFYVLIFDHATDAVLDRLDIGADYRRRSNCSIFVAEAHVTYEREVREGQEVSVASRLADFEGSRMIIYHEMTASALTVLSPATRFCASMSTLMPGAACRCRPM